MRKIPQLNSLQAFEAASRLGSFIKAAEELHITPSAISHRIRELEHKLGITLFHRVHRSVVLTDAGQKYANQIGEAFGLIESASQETTRAGKSDLITLHIVPSLGAQWLTPRLARFSAQYPDIDIRTTATLDMIDLKDGVVDFDIRYGTVLHRAGIEVEPFPPEPIVALCSPALVDEAPGLRCPDDLSRYMLIHSETNRYTWRDWLNDHPGVALNLERGLRFDRSFMSIYAAVDGMGVCLESGLLAERQLHSGVLVLPFGKEGPRISCHSICYLSSRAHLPKMRIFRKWLQQELAESPALSP